MIRRPVLLVGESPNPATEGHPHLWLLPDSSGIPHSANRLLEHTGWKRQEYLRIFERTNLLEKCPPARGKGRAFPRRGTQERVLGLLHQASEAGQDVVLLGRRLSRLFAFADEEGAVEDEDLEYLRWYSALNWSCATKIAVVPHPSGVNVWWNVEGNRGRARNFFQQLRERHIAAT